jgi:hypothetical protein
VGLRFGSGIVRFIEEIRVGRVIEERNLKF